MAQTPVPTILKFAESVRLTSPTLVADLRVRMSNFPVANVPAKHRAAFETKGIELWNLATRHRRGLSTEGHSDANELSKVALLRVYAFGMLESIAITRTKKNKREETCERTLKLAFKCIEACIEAKELEYAVRIGQSAADWLDEGADVLSHDAKRQLDGEYLVWRIALVSFISNRGKNWC